MTHSMKVTQPVNDRTASRALSTRDCGIQAQCHVPTSACYGREEGIEKGKKREKGAERDNGRKRQKGGG